MKVGAWPAVANRHDNPYNWLLYSEVAKEGVDVLEFRPRRVLDGTADIWHLHWPDALLNDKSRTRVIRDVSGTLALVRIARARGTAIVWTVHNLSSHDGRYPEIEKRYWSAFTSQLDGIISPSRAGLSGAVSRWPTLGNVPSFVIPLGHYRAVFSAPPDRAAARADLGIAPDAKVVAFVGQVRTYKDVPALARAFRGEPDPKLRLVVAGRPEDETTARQVRDAVGSDERILLRLAFIPDGDLQSIVRAADLVVLPYQNILNSGSALLALSLDCPILVPDRGAMAELVEDVGAEWVRTYGGPLTTDTLASAVSWATTTTRAPTAPLTAFEWPQIASATVDAYDQIVYFRRHRRTKPGV